MNSYLLFKSLHLIAVISWMAGLLYLPRIFVYHSENNNEIITNVFKTMERKLFYYIMTPAMILSWLFGLLLIHEIGFQQLASLWLQSKLVLVILLTAYHFYLGLLLNQFRVDQNKKTSKFYRYINEIPTLLLILIVFVPDQYFSIVPLCFWNKVVQLRAIPIAKIQTKKIEDFSVKSVHYILRLLLPTIERG